MRNDFFNGWIHEKVLWEVRKQTFLMEEISQNTFALLASDKQAVGLRTSRSENLRQR